MAIELLGCTFLPFGVLCFLSTGIGGSGSGGGLGSLGEPGGPMGNTGVSKDSKNLASRRSFFDDVKLISLLEYCTVPCLDLIHPPI